MIRRVSLLTLALLALAAATALGQTREVTASTLTVGGSLASPSGSSLRLGDLGTSGGTYVLVGDATDGGNIRARLLGKTDLPSTVGYLDEAENVTQSWAFTAGLTGTTASFSSTLGVTGLATLAGGFTAAAASTVNANLTIGGANDLIVGTGGIRAGSGAVLLRNVADSATVASFGDSAIALNQATTVGANLTVSSSNDLIVGTGGIRAGSGDVLIRNVADSTTSASIGDSAIALNRNTAVTGTFSVSSTSTLTGNVTAAADLAVNGGDITSTAATLNLDAGGTVQVNDALVLAASNTLRSANFASRTTGWGITYAGEADFRYTYADEFYTKNFIADLETALNGGQIIAKSTVVLAQNFTCPAASGTTTLWVRDFPGHPNLRVFAASDWVVLRSMTRADADNDGNIEFSIGDCVGQVSSYTDGTSANEGTQSWTFTRGTLAPTANPTGGAMAASTVVAADALVIDYGVSGQGFLVARANDGTEGSQSPYWQVVTWTTAPVAANMTVQTRWGNLSGSYGYSAAAYGFATGSPTGANLTVEPTNGIRINAGTTTRASWDSAGTITLGETGSGQENFVISSTSLVGRIGTDNFLNINSTDGVVVGRPGVAGIGWLQINPTGTVFVNNGSATRLALASSNGALTLYDDDGSTVRAQIGATAAVFGGTSGARLQYTYSSGLFEGYDGSGNRRLWWDASNGLVLGTGSNGSGQPYVQLGATSLLFCEDGGTCPLSFDGATGNITSTGNLALQGNATVGGSGHIKGGATAYATGTGFWLGFDSGTPKLYVGNGTSGSANFLTWNGATLAVTGALTTDAGLNITGNTGGGAAINTGSLSNLRIQNSTVLGTIELSASGGLNVNIGGGTSGSGVTGTKTVRASGGASDCTLVFIMGVLTGGSC